MLLLLHLLLAWALHPALVARSVQRRVPRVAITPTLAEVASLPRVVQKVSNLSFSIVDCDIVDLIVLSFSLAVIVSSLFIDYDVVIVILVHLSAQHKTSKYLSHSSISVDLSG